MTENRKKIGLLIIIIAILLLAIIIIIFLKRNQPAVDNTPIVPVNTGGIVGSANTAPTAPTSTPGDAPRNYQAYDVTKEAPHKINANDAAKLSALFAERLGSFSNQSDYSNVTDLKILMTADMKDWADKYVADLRAQKYSGQYYGIITKALTTKILSPEKDGQIKIEIQTERQESNADVVSASYLQKMTLDLVKANDEWLVDGAYWEKK